MLWEVEVRPAPGEIDREAARVLSAGQAMGIATLRQVVCFRLFLLEGELSETQIREVAGELLADPVAERWSARRIDQQVAATELHDRLPHDRLSHDRLIVNVLFKPGVTDNVGETARRNLAARQLPVTAVATARRYEVNHDLSPPDLKRFTQKVLANEAIERAIHGPLRMATIAVGKEYALSRIVVPIRELDAAALQQLSRDRTLSLSLIEMQTIQQYFVEQGRDPTDAELETVAQTWSEHCSHKTLGGRIRYSDGTGTREFRNMLKETIFAATVSIRESLGAQDWCVSVFKDNAGIVTFNDQFDVCIKVETHNRPSALEPYGGANTGLGGVIRDCLGTGLGGRPVCSTDVFCFAPLDTPYASLPAGVLHPRVVAVGVVAGVRDYGNRMGIPTVNGAVYFDPRYVGNPLVFCGNVATIPRHLGQKRVDPGAYIVAVGGRTGLDGIHGATFSSAQLTAESEQTSGGAVQIGNAITEKMVTDALLCARDEGLFTAITDCGAGGFSSAVGEMGEETGAEVWLDRAPLKYAGLTYTEIWISEAQERMVLAVPPANWERFNAICIAEGVEATIIGQFTDTQRLVLKYADECVADMPMSFLHDGRPPIVREAVFQPRAERPLKLPVAVDIEATLEAILSCPNVASKEWVIRQYDHEVLGGSVVKPLLGATEDGPSDAAVVQPDLASERGLVISNGMNPYYGDLDPYWMAAAGVDEALRNCVCVGGDPARTAILDNFCWGNTDAPEVLGDLTRAALGAADAAIAFKTPFVSGKDSLHNEFKFEADGRAQTIRIPGTLLISAMGQIDDIGRAVTMDAKRPGNVLYLVGETRNELGGSHFALVHRLSGGAVPKVDLELAPALFAGVHRLIESGVVRACHDLSEGGLAVAAAEMAMAGSLGIEIDLRAAQTIGELEGNVIHLFSESPSRFLMEVDAAAAAQAEELLSGLPHARIGRVTESPRLLVLGRDGETVVDADVHGLRARWKAAIAWE